MFSVLVGALGALALAWPAAAQVTPFPGDFRTQEITTDNGATIHLRVGGQGPAVVLLHGFGDTGDMWAPLATELVRDYTVVVPDLRGMGLSSHPAAGYDRRTQAADVRAILTHLRIERAAIVGHDIGTMVAYAYAAHYPDTTAKLVVMDAPVPGIPPWDDIVRTPLLWHFSFGGPDAERLVAGRERMYLDRFWNEFAGDPAKIDEATRVHYATLYARPGAMRVAFAQFLAFPTDVRDNQASLGTTLPMPVLAIGGAQSFGATQAVVMRNAAIHVTEVVIPWGQSRILEGGHRMRQITFLLIAVATVAGVVAYTAPASEHTAQEAAPIFVDTIPPGYRDWRLISVAHEAGDLNDLRAILGNDVAIEAYRAGQLPFPDGTIIARLAWSYDPSEENNKVFGRPQSFVAGPPKNGVQFMVKDARKYAATGGWGFAHFNDGKPAAEAVLNTCFPCHAAIKDRDLVFTRYAP